MKIRPYVLYIIFRRLKVSGKVFSETLLPAEGALPLLYHLGFSDSEDGEFLEKKIVDQPGKAHEVFFINLTRAFAVVTIPLVPTEP